MEQQASSAGTSPVEFRDCIEEVLKYTLESHINGSLEVDLLLSSDFCSQLLSTGTETPCPLYKRLASALCEAIYSNASCTIDNEVVLRNKGSDLKRKEAWNELMLEKGFEIFYILKNVDFELHVQEPFFTQLRDGIKTVEGRCAVGDYNRIGSGSLILFNKCLLLEVQEVRRYASFFEMLEAETHEKVLPGVKTIEQGIQVYRKFYSEEKEKYSGVLGIHVKKLSFQLYISLARILLEMSYGGIERLLGLAGSA